MARFRKNIQPSHSVLFVLFLALFLNVCSCAAPSSTDETPHTPEALETSADSESSVTIQNTTSYELLNISLTYNQTRTCYIEKMEENSAHSAALPEDIGDITSVKISGRTADGKIFSNSFSGLFSNDSTITVYLNEEMNLSVSSNTEE